MDPRVTDLPVDAREPMSAQEPSLQWMLDSIPVPLAVITSTDEIETLNQAVLDYFGKAREEMKSWSGPDTIHPDDLSHVLRVRSRAIETGEAYEVDSRRRRYDGVYRWFHARGFPLRDAGDRIHRWCVLLTDINDRKRAEAQLAGEKRLLEMVASDDALTEVLTQLCRFVEDTSDDCKCGVYLIDWSVPAFRIGAVPSLPATFNDPVEGLPVSREIGPCGVAALEKAQVVAADVESDPLWKSCAIRPLLLAHGFRSQWSTPIRARDGHVLGTFAIFQPHPASPTPLQQDLIAQVTHIASIAIERRLSEEALSKARSDLAHVSRVMSLGALTASIAHEVNQPLSGIVTNASTCKRMLESDPPNVEGARETARRTIRDGHRAAEVIAKLRALFSKHEAAVELVDLNEATREVIALSWGDLARQRVILRTLLADDLPPVRGDRVQLQQVILNLLRNAADAMSEIEDRPRDLVIRTEADEESRVRLSVEDVGVGFAPEGLDRMFEAFYSTKTHGMGIGLSVSRSIIENHQGRLWATVNAGPGATFWFAIPRAVEGATLS